MTRILRLLSLSVGLLLVPALAYAQWDSPNRSFHKATAFPLEGRHLAVPCASCHLNGVTKGTPKTCESCHWQRRQDDVYRLRLGTQCGTCHKPTAWSAVKWDHGATTGMPLGGAHRTLTCTTCHKNNRFAGTSANCVSCHRKDFDQAQNPTHVAGGYSTACDGCHRVSDPTWHSGTGVNHASFFALVGLHATAACTSCHINNVFAGTPRTCYGCHRTDYDKTSNPAHAAAGFPTTCDSCHKNTDTSWSQGKFTHTAFPITSGRHAGIACATCHTTPSTYSVFSCLTGCHAKSSTDSNHRSVGGYRYDSQACYTCHPNGRAG
jgi:hypothetical protein